MVDNMKTIPIVFASDENYAMPMCVAITSMLKNMLENTFYEIYILVDKEFSIETKDKIVNASKNYSNYNIEFIIIGNKFDNVYITIEHITKVTYYRLAISSLLPQIDKCIYLDVDIIVNNDLQELYNINIEDYYIAGVKAPNYHINSKYHSNRLNIDVQQYVNAGVLIINLKNIRKKNLEEMFTKLLSNNYSSQDQDIINVACANNIKNIDFKYNLMTKYFYFTKYIYDINNIIYNDALLYVFNHAEIVNSIENNIIIHYADKIKPWSGVSSEFANIWWDYWRISNFNDDLELIKKDPENNIEKYEKGIVRK